MMQETFKPAASTKKRISNRAVKKETSSLSTRPQQAECQSCVTVSNTSKPLGQRSLCFGLLSNRREKTERLDLVKEPVPNQRFPSSLVLSLMKRLVDERLGAMEYSPACSAVATELSESIKETAKSLSNGRYKLICCVAIGQLCNSAVSCSSRGIWSPDTDTFTEYLFKNQHLFALCVLFTVYQE